MRSNSFADWRMRDGCGATESGGALCVKREEARFLFAAIKQKAMMLRVSVFQEDFHWTVCSSTAASRFRLLFPGTSFRGAYRATERLAPLGFEQGGRDRRL